MALRLIIEDFDGATTIVPLEQEPVTIGRTDANTIQLNEKNVSRSHAKLVLLDDGWTVEDLGSYNGVHVNGSVINERVVLREGDIITIGDYSLVLHDDVGKKTVDLDRPIKAANQAQEPTGPMLASSSQDLPKLSPSELHAMSTESLPPMAAVVDEPEEGRSRGLMIGVLIGAVAAAVLGAVVIIGQSGNAANDAGPSEPPAAESAANESAQEAAEAEGTPAEAAATDAEEGEAAAAEAGAVEDATEEVDEGADEGEAVEEGEAIEEGEAAEETEDAPAAAAAPKKSAQPRKQTADPEKAASLLADARKAQLAGDANTAYKLAKQSYDANKTGDALKVMAVSACKMGSASKAKKAYSKMSSGKDAVKKLCESNGITL